MDKLKDKIVNLSTNKKIIIALLFIILAVSFWWVLLIIGFIAFAIWVIGKFSKTKLFHQYRKVTLAVIASIIVVPLLVNRVHGMIENSRDYYIITEDSVTFDCNPTYNEQTKQMACQQQTLTGEFSKYDSVEVKYGSMNGNQFSMPIFGYAFYSLQNLDVDSLSKGVDENETITLYNKVLNKTVSEKIVKVHYNLTEQDILKIRQIHDEWKIAEAKRIAQEETDKKAQEEADNVAEENRLATEAAKKQEEAAQAAQAEYTMPEDTSIYDIKELCERHAEGRGYPNAKIKLTTLSGLDLEDGNHYKVSGTLYIDEGITVSERAVGDYACTANYNTWTVTGAFLNRQEI